MPAVSDVRKPAWTSFGFCSIDKDYTLARVRIKEVRVSFWESLEWKILAPLIIVVAVAITYSNTLNWPFILDDINQIETKTDVHQLWPLTKSSMGPQLVRPFLYFSLAVNWAISDYAKGVLHYDDDTWKKNHYDVCSYHVLNILAHVLAALALYGIVRRTLLTDRMKDRFGEHASPLAFIVAMLWALHPLQTGAVTYIIQRAESMMGLFYLLTLYCYIRAIPKPGKYSYGWGVLAFAACSLGMLTKQVMVTALIMIVLYDGIFLAGFKWANIKGRLPLYGMLLASYYFLVVTLYATFSNTGDSAGFGLPFGKLQYAQTQFGVVIFYLRLAFLPYPLCLDYYWPIATLPQEIYPYLAMVVALVGLSIWALWKKPEIGYLGMWYFLILAPTSTIMPIKDVIFEHRMYLPLAAPLCLLVLGFYQWAFIDKFARSKTVLFYGLSIIAVVIAGLFMPLPMLPFKELLARQGIYFLATAVMGGLFVLAWLTGGKTLVKVKALPTILPMILAVVVAIIFAVISYSRNATYATPVTVWQDVADKRPENPRAHSNLGVSLIYANSINEGMAHLRRAVECDPTFVDAYYNMGVMLNIRQDNQGSMDNYRKATEADPKYIIARYNLAAALANAGRVPEAIKQYDIILEQQPDHAMAMVNLATLYIDQGHFDQACQLLDQAIKLDPKIVPAYELYAKAMDATGRPEQAVKYRELARQAPNIAAPGDNPADIIASVIILLVLFVGLPIMVIVANVISNAVNARSDTMAKVLEKADKASEQ
jgi:tetratricopeptide (TPR) repeat protein